MSRLLEKKLRWKPSFKRVKTSMIVALAVVDYRRNLGNRLYKTLSKLR